MALTSFFTALTGLNSNSHTINVIGDNIANMNTIGFKAGKATFAELIGGMSGFSATGNPIVFGQGSALNGVVHKQAQGTPEYTGNSTDAMINGNGYFVVATGDGGIGYTRAGRFQFDSTGGLVSSDGYQLMGYMADDDGVISTVSGITPIEVRMGQFVRANATTQMAAAVNLDSQTPFGAGAASSFATAVQVYDSLGSVHNITVTFTKGDPATLGDPTTESSQWSWVATIPEDDVAGGTPPIELGSGDVVFDKFGLLKTPAMGDPTAVLALPAGVTLANGATLKDIDFMMWDDQGRPLITSAASESGTSYTKQNGFAASTLASVAFTNTGVVIGIAANGNAIELAQLAIATFPNVEGMQKYNGSTLIASSNAGEPSIGAAGSGGRGMVQGGSLEMSNVDMAEEFINLIIAQRAFQANARVITTSDELYQEAIHLKR